MTTAEAFLEDIIAHPEDDTLRLIYADYLSEHGQEERARFIQVQVHSGKELPISCEFGRPLPCGDLGEGMSVHGLFQLGVTEISLRRGFVSLVRLSCSSWMEHGPALVKQHPLERVELSDKKPFDSSVHPGHLGWTWLYTYPGHEDHFNLLAELFYSVFPELLFGGSGLPHLDTPEEACDVLSEGVLRWARKKRDGVCVLCDGAGMWKKGNPNNICPGCFEQQLIREQENALPR